MANGIHHKEVIDNLKYCVVWGLWRRQKTIVGKALKLISRLKAQYFTVELACFYHKAKRLYKWLLLPENIELWIKERKIIPERGSLAYLKWRSAILKRDNRTCQDCGKKKMLVAHHIKSYKDYKELRLDVNNGRTLCHQCHWEAHRCLN